MAAVQYDLKEQERIYERWARVYDKVYLRLLAASHRKVAEAASAAGRRILEVGVGTGLVLRYYAHDREVIGADLSLPMLRKAAEKVTDFGLSQVRGLVAMDACRLGFADESFDVVSVPFVLTLVPDPEGALDEMARVLKPGGEIVIVSRFGAEKGMQEKLEAGLAPLMKKVGWSSSFKVSRVANWAAKRGDVEMGVVEPGLYFTLVRLKKKG
jgi:phosphatidylethanolamine/phosphatidyl-N-methylethanolamine N-methyltransferase